MTINEVLTDENIKFISKKAFALNEIERKDNSVLIALQKDLKQTKKSIANIMSAIEQGIITPSTKERLSELDELKIKTLSAIAKEEITKPRVTVEQMEFLLNDMKNRIDNAENKAEIIISTFVNSVYLYDDRLIITYNYKEGDSLKKLEVKDLKKFGFDGQTPTMTILSELFMFAIIIKLPRV